MNKKNIITLWIELLTNPDSASITGKKMQLSLSEYAWRTLQLDMTTYKIDTPATLYNIILKNYINKSHCNPMLYHRNISDTYTSILKNEGINDELTINNIIEKLTDKYITDFKEINFIKSPTIGHKFFLNKYNCQRLIDIDKEIIYTYQKPSKFVSAVIEEYTRLPNVDRLEIIQKDIINEINYTIKNHTMGILTNEKGRFLMKPYKIIAYNDKKYLMCKSVDITKSNNEPFQVFPNNLEKILNYTDTGRPFSFSEDDIDDIERAIKEKGVAFSGNTLKNIKVKFTEEGEKKYTKTLIRKPEVINKKGLVYEFRCTDFEAENFFRRFGQDAVVLDEQIHEKLMNEYYEMYISYKKAKGF